MYRSSNSENGWYGLGMGYSMSPTAIILLVGIMSGNWSKTVSDKIVETHGLESAGKWEGVAWAYGEIWWVELLNSKLVMRGAFGNAVSSYKKKTGTDYWEVGEIEIVASGKLIVRKDYFSPFYVGIYKYQHDRLVICFGRPELGDATTFQAGNQQWLLILHHCCPN